MPPQKKTTIENASFLARQPGYKYYSKGTSDSNRKTLEVLQNRPISFFEKTVDWEGLCKSISSDIFKI